MTLPNGFTTAFQTIMRKDNSTITRLKNENKCICCVEPLDSAHVFLCHKCVHEMSDRQLDVVIKRFRKLGFYPSFFMKIISKLGLVKNDTKLKLRFEPNDKDLWFLEDRDVCQSIRKWAMKNNRNPRIVLEKINQLITEKENRKDVV